MTLFLRRRTALVLAAAASLPLAITALAQTRFSRDLVRGSSDRLLEPKPLDGGALEAVLARFFGAPPVANGAA